MQGFQQLFNLLLKDYQKELTEEFDRNFERKAFFDKVWKEAKRNNIGSLLNRTGALRKSISDNSSITGKSISWTSSLAYANIQNVGGKITVTSKMRGFFWYKFRMATGGNNKNMNTEALFWKSMALKKVGSVIIIPQRQFIGDHPQVHKSIREVTDDWVQYDLKPFIDEKLNFFNDGTNNSRF